MGINFPENLMKEAETMGLNLSALNAPQLLDLKRMLSRVNNLLSKELGLKFIELIKMNKPDKERLKEKFWEIKPNANGYDLVDVDERIIAEIKCNIPCKKDHTYGAQQIKNILDDIEHMANENKKKKHKPPIDQLSNYTRFMVLLKTEYASICFKQIKRKLADKVSLEEWDGKPAENLSKDKIYVAFVEL